MIRILICAIAISCSACTRNDIRIGYESGTGTCSSDVKVTTDGFVAVSSCNDSSKVSFEVNK